MSTAPSNYKSRLYKGVIYAIYSTGFTPFFFIVRPLLFTRNSCKHRKIVSEPSDDVYTWYYCMMYDIPLCSFIGRHYIWVHGGVLSTGTIGQYHLIHKGVPLLLELLPQSSCFHGIGMYGK